MGSCAGAMGELFRVALKTVMIGVLMLANKRARAAAGALTPSETRE